MFFKWQKIIGEYGPPINQRLSHEEVSELLSEKSFEAMVKMEIGHDYYGITAVKT
ncbi:MAG: hypothetical protein ACYCYE_17340 [Clostridia bacterium]